MASAPKMTDPWSGSVGLRVPIGAVQTRVKVANIFVNDTMAIVRVGL